VRIFDLRLTIYALLAFSALAVSSFAVTIGWDPSPGADGYRVYHGQTSLNYTRVVEAGTNTQLRLQLPDGDNFIALTAYKSFQTGTILESDYSKELWFYASNPPPPTMNLRVEKSSDLAGPWQALVNVTVTNEGGPMFFRTTLTQ
jgi:hypothetical protein